MKKIVLVSIFTLFSSLAMAEKGPWTLNDFNVVRNIYVCHYQRVETIHGWSNVQNAYTVGIGRCIPPLF